MDKYYNHVYTITAADITSEPFSNISLTSGGLSSIKTTTNLTKSLELNCKNYGFDCNYSTSNSDVAKVISDFQKHTSEIHYIDYPEGVLMRFIMNKRHQSYVVKINLSQN